jgi:hypothetical protein
VLADEQDDDALLAGDLRALPRNPSTLRCPVGVMLTVKLTRRCGA